MLKLLKFHFLAMAFAVVFSDCKADTLDYWHVKYNNRLIRQYNLNSRNRLIILKTNEIKATDKITVSYFRDTPCSDCFHEILLENDNEKLSVANGKGTFSPMSFLINSIKNYKKANVKVYYHETGHQNLYLFTIQIK